MPVKDLQPIEHSKLKADPKLYGLAQLYLQQAVELLFGTAAYLVMALALPKPEAYHDILDALAAHSVIERPLAYRLEHLPHLPKPLGFDGEPIRHDEAYGHNLNRLPDPAAFLGHGEG